MSNAYSIRDIFDLLDALQIVRNAMMKIGVVNDNGWDVLHHAEMHLLVEVADHADMKLYRSYSRGRKKGTRESAITYLDGFWEIPPDCALEPKGVTDEDYWPSSRH